MRVLIAALALTSILLLAAPGAVALNVPDPNNLPPINPQPVTQCLGSSVVIHVCAVAILGLPQRTDAAPPTVEAPTYACSGPGTPGAVNTLITCQVNLKVNGRNNSLNVTLSEGRTIP